MNEAIAISLSSLQQDMTRLERVGMNLANSTTPGYKREVVLTQTAAQPFGNLVEAGVAANGGPSATTSSGAFAPAMRMATDNRAGALKRTGGDLDLALAGDGYFEIATESGPAFTRQGNFHVDARGRIVNPQGQPLMGEGGDIVVGTSKFSIDARGQVFDLGEAGERVGARPLATIKVVRFEGRSQMQRLGNGLLLSAGGLAGNSATASGTLVRQGYLEESNVSSMHEMVELMQTMRHFETMQKVAVGYDDMVGVAIRKLGDAS